MSSQIISVCPYCIDTSRTTIFLFTTEGARNTHNCGRTSYFLDVKNHKFWVIIRSLKCVHMGVFTICFIFYICSWIYNITLKRLLFFDLKILKISMTHDIYPECTVYIHFYVVTNCHWQRYVHSISMYMYKKQNVVSALINGCRLTTWDELFRIQYLSLSLILFFFFIEENQYVYFRDTILWIWGIYFVPIVKNMVICILSYFNIVEWSRVWMAVLLNS